MLATFAVVSVIAGASSERTNAFVVAVFFAREDRHVINVLVEIYLTSVLRIRRILFHVKALIARAFEHHGPPVVSDRLDVKRRNGVIENRLQAIYNLGDSVLANGSKLSFVRSDFVCQSHV